MKIELVFDDWRVGDLSIMYSEIETEARLTEGDFHPGTVFEGEITLSKEDEAELREHLTRFVPVFRLLAANDDPKRPPNGTAPSATRTEHKRISPPTLAHFLSEVGDAVYFAQFTGNDWIEASQQQKMLHTELTKIVRRAYEAGLDASARASDGFRKPATSREKPPALDIPASFPAGRGKLFKT